MRWSCSNAITAGDSFHGRATTFCAPVLAGREAFFYLKEKSFRDRMSEIQRGPWRFGKAKEFLFRKETKVQRDK